MPALRIQLDAPLPAELPAGPPTAVFVAGTCFAPGARIAALELTVDGEPRPLLAHGMPRLDHLRAHGDPAAYASGFWGLAPVHPRSGAVTIGLRARLRGGGELVEDVGRIPVTALPEPLPGACGIAVCMATYEPPPELLARQLDSIRAQTHTDWTCVISDDCSSPAAFARLEALVGDDPRFTVSRSPRRLGFFRNFERALALAPRGARAIALADQDDAWDPDKLETLAAALGGAQLVYSDARVVRPDGELVAPTYWSRRRNNHEDLLSLLVANSVTGAASLFPRDLLDVALPFPPAQFAHFHDHWLGLCARALGEIRFVDRPLYDYVQHDGAALGHAAANQMPRLRERLGVLRRDPRDRIRMWRTHYFADACRLLQVSAILLARCGDRMPAARRSVLEDFLRADAGLASLVRLGARGARELTRARPETLGAEWMLAYAFAWRRMLAAGAHEAPQRRLRLDAVPPPALDAAPGAGAASGPPAVRAIAEKIAPLRVAPADDAPRRVNLLIPTVDLKHFFGGYIAKFNLARRLAERGHRVRVVTVDPTGSLPADWRRRVEDYAGLGGVLDRVEVAFGREAAGLEVSRDDVFVATTWWTAHIAAAALGVVRAERFLYLIQEYEPFTFPMGSHAALADASYELPHTALFSTELLRGFFRARGLGVYAGGADSGDAASAAFQNAITPVAPAPAAELERRRPRRLLFYARPEPHAARNMFELGVLALGRAAAAGAFTGWALRGVGTVGGARRVPLGSGAVLELLPRTGQAGYAGLLREHDVGLALMYTPHPSLVPLEMASAGMVTVTNSYANKTAGAMAAISANLRCAPPTVDGIADALCAATAAAGDVDARIAGSRVHWSRDWSASFADPVMERIEALLG